jgi:hypothetical protein
MLRMALWRSYGSRFLPGSSWVGFRQPERAEELWIVSWPGSSWVGFRQLERAKEGDYADLSE